MSETYIYKGNRDGNNTATGIIYGDQGEIVEEDQPPVIPIGGEIKLSASERDRLAPYFILENKDGKDAGEGLTPPSSTAPDAVHTDVNEVPDESDTSGSKGTLQEKDSPSATSKKS